MIDFLYMWYYSKKKDRCLWQTINTQGHYYSLAKRQDRRFIAIVSSEEKARGDVRARRTFDSRPRLPAEPWGAIVTHNWWAARRGSRSPRIGVAQKKSPESALRIARVPPCPWWLYNVVSRGPGRGQLLSVSVRTFPHRHRGRQRSRRRP